MPTLDVITLGEGAGGRVDLDPAVFEAPLRPHLLHDEVRRQLALRRRGTHATRNRNAVSGGGSKPYRQKGTGHARQGTRRAPQFAGGGVVFGPVPRSHAHAGNKKARKAALRCALSLRSSEDAIRVVDALPLDGFSTRRLAGLLRDAGVAADGGVLIVIEAGDPHIERSARNLPYARVLRAEGLNVYDVLRCRQLLFTRAALAAVEERLGAAAPSEAEPAAAPADEGGRS